MATNDDYDLVVLDVMLPGADGWHVIQEIRKRKSVRMFPATRIALLFCVVTTVIFTVAGRYL